MLISDSQVPILFILKSIPSFIFISSLHFSLPDSLFHFPSLLLLLLLCCIFANTFPLPTFLSFPAAFFCLNNLKLRETNDKKKLCRETALKNTPGTRMYRHFRAFQFVKSATLFIYFFTKTSPTQASLPFLTSLFG